MTDWYEWPSNFSNSSVQGVGDLFKYANYVTSGWAVNFILIAIFIIVYVALLPFQSKRAFSVAIFITTVISILFSSLGIIHPAVPLIGIVLTIVSIIWMKSETPQF